MKRYIWLGDSKYGGNVYWDKKRNIVVRSKHSKNSAKKNQFNVYYLFSTFIILILFRIISFLFKVKLNTVSVSTLSIIIFTIFFTTGTTFFIYHVFYGIKNEYTETTWEDAMHAINSTGYLKNPLIFMLLDKKLHYMVVTFCILFVILGITQSMSLLNNFQTVIRIPAMILFISIPIYMIYLVNFKKDNRLKL